MINKDNNVNDSKDEIEKCIADVNLKDQFYLLSLLVIYVGIVSLDTYYQAFNIRYQTLNLPASHILFRGLTAIITNWYILVMYAVSALWLVFQKPILIIVSKRQIVFAGILPYLFVGAVIAINYPLARYAGMKAAKLDMCETTCSLPRVISISRKSCSTPLPDCTYSGSRLLLNDGSFLILFWPLKLGINSEVLNIYRIAKEDVNVFKTTIK